MDSTNKQQKDHAKDKHPVDLKLLRELSIWHGKKWELMLVNKWQCRNTLSY